MFDRILEGGNGCGKGIESEGVDGIIAGTPQKSDKVWRWRSKKRTPLAPLGSNIFPHAFITNASLTDTTKICPADFALSLLM